MAQRGKKGSDVERLERMSSEGEESTPTSERTVPERTRAGTRRSQTEFSMPTETPGASTAGILQFIVSVDAATGVPTKIEKLDVEEGKRTELSQQEYATAFAYASYSSPYYATQAAAHHDPLSNPAVQAYVEYLKNVSDYLQLTLSQPQ